MKSINFIVVACCVLFFGCYSDDGDSNRNKYLQIYDAVTFDNRENYKVGDTLYLALKFSRYLNEEGYDDLLDIYESSGSASFSYAIDLEKYSEFSDDFRYIAIAPKFIFSETGEIGEYGSIDAVLNESETEYSSKIGIILAEEGRFNFNMDYLYLGNRNYSEDFINISISHSFRDTIPNFEFVVSDE